MTEIMLNNDLVLEMAEKGVLFGHKKSKTHPRMKPYISGAKNELELLDPEAVITSLNRAIEFLETKIIKENGLILLVGTMPATRAAVESFAEVFNFPYVKNRWLGGTLTNFKVINSRCKYYEDLKNKQARGELAKYTKKEQYKFSQEINKLKINFEGLQKLTRLPDAVFIIDPLKHDTALREARRLHISTVAIIDTDDDPALIDWPIFANDHSRQSIEWIISKIKEQLITNNQQPITNNQQPTIND